MSIADTLTITPLTVDHDGLGYRGMTLSELREAGLPADVLRAAAVDWLQAAIDGRAEALRHRMTTPGSGQAMEYQETQAQAAAALKAPASASPAKYPMLAASIGIDIDPDTREPAIDVLGVARSIDAARTVWLTLGAAIRGTRLGAKRDIGAAPSIEDACDAFDAVTWPQLPST